VLLLESYTCRAETFMNSWFRSMLEQDVAGHPQQRADGTLRTMGAIEFFKMLNEQVGLKEKEQGSLAYSGALALGR
jgi:exocyst complex component 3